MIAPVRPRPIALVRRPTPSLVDGLVTHIERRPVDFAAALDQWQGYVDAMIAAGWEIVEVAPDPECADAVFIEDAAVVVGSTALICRPGAVSRRAEVEPVAIALAALGIDCHRVGDPATIDGGDVLQVGSTLYIGLGGRTNAEGIACAAEVFSDEGATVVAVPNDAVLHLKSAITALPDGTIVGFGAAVADATAFPPFVAMPEESGAHVVDIGNGSVLMATDCPGSAEIVAGFGFDPVHVDIGEFEKLEGCVTCLSIRLPAAPAPGG